MGWICGSFMWIKVWRNEIEHLHKIGGTFESLLCTRKRKSLGLALRFCYSQEAAFPTLGRTVRRPSDFLPLIFDERCQGAFNELVWFPTLKKSIKNKRITGA